MFTPHRVAGGPGQTIKLEKVRITIGTFVASGERFKTEDGYTEPRAAHMMLEHAWVGTSEFRAKINCEDNSKSSNKWVGWASDEEYEGFDAAASTSQVVVVNEKGRPDAKTATHRQIWSLTARVPLRRGDPVGGRWRDRPCIESALSSPARSRGWIRGSQIKVVFSS